jgi:hypothetical protein
MNLYIDIETCGLSTEEVLQVAPTFDAPANYKDPVKIADAIKDKQAAFVDGAALSAMTGRVLAVTTALGEEEPHVAVSPTQDTEAGLLREAFTLISETIQKGSYVVGYNILRFDLPFMIRRAWFLGVRVPACIRIRNSMGRSQWSPGIVDLLAEFAMGDKPEGMALDKVAHRMLGRRKSGGGKDFADLLKTNPEAAYQYCQNDVTLCRDIFGCMCPIGIV